MIEERYTKFLIMWKFEMRVRRQQMHILAFHCEFNILIVEMVEFF